MCLSLLTKDEKVDGHRDADEGEERGEQDRVAGDAGVPGAGAEFSDEDEVLGDGGDEDDDAERDEGYSGEEREAGLVDGGGVGLQGRLGGLHLAKEEAEASDGEAHAHESEAGADPGEEGALRGEEDARVAFGSVGGHVVTVAFWRCPLSVVRCPFGS